jgi:hypothetical protein
VSSYVGLLSITLLAVAYASGEASAQNLLKNPRFDRDLASWQVVDAADRAPGAMSWSTADADGSSSSGSLELRTSATFGRETFSVGQCVTVKESPEYAAFGGKIRAPAGQPVAGLADLHVEYFQSAACSGQGLTQSGLGGIANADFWSRRRDFALIHGAGSVRLIASVRKTYEFQEGDQTSQIDDHLVFHAFFDNLFLQLTAEPDLGKFLRSLPTEAPQTLSDTATTAVWGKKTVQGPTLSLKAFGSDGRELDSGHLEFSSLEQIGVVAALSTPYAFDDPEWYPLQGFSLATREGDQYPRRQPTLEFLLRRAGDSGGNPMQISVDSSGGGVVDGHPNALAHISLAGKSDYRIQVLRTLLGCLMASLPDDRRKAAPKLTDDQLLTAPLAEYIVANPPGDYELVARYQALEAGFWHSAVYSAPLRLRIVRREVDCGKPLRPR